MYKGTQITNDSLHINSKSNPPPPQPSFILFDGKRKIYLVKRLFSDKIAI